ncbi:GNAT family N-acetyltransferase [Chitinophaga oryziterrae]|uniref:GNAT family N-acetyltransferase n=1 Tax=Chitinophaga oryziterrae TaxID=1031224 RepID=A0A6N8J975_9BACT|nr:GNAT family N-acetyltransferase [Chitinophaga oryziterrae]MVT40846.1 GNAT family N-acetyltransferase [Chitinophaga oryziterrae]
MIELIKVTSSDIIALQTLSRQTFFETFAAENTPANMQAFLDKAFQQEGLLKEINNSHSVFYFAKTGDNIIGYLKINTGAAQTELREEDGIEIERIYVLKEFQGQKAGQLMLDKALQMGREKNAAYVWLGVWEKNTKAISFYAKNGFIAFSSHIFRFGDEDQTDIMMKLVL